MFRIDFPTSPPSLSLRTGPQWRRIGAVAVLLLIAVMWCFFGTLLYKVNIWHALARGLANSEHHGLAVFAICGLVLVDTMLLTLGIGFTAGLITLLLSHRLSVETDGRTVSVRAFWGRFCWRRRCAVSSIDVLTLRPTPAGSFEWEKPWRARRCSLEARLTDGRHWTVARLPYQVLKAAGDPLATAMGKNPPVRCIDLVDPVLLNAEGHGRTPPAGCRWGLDRTRDGLSIRRQPWRWDWAHTLGNPEFRVIVWIVAVPAIFYVAGKTLMPSVPEFNPQPVFRPFFGVVLIMAALQAISVWLTERQAGIRVTADTVEQTTWGVLSSKSPIQWPRRAVAGMSIAYRRSPKGQAWADLYLHFHNAKPGRLLNGDPLVLRWMAAALRDELRVPPVTTQLRDPESDWQFEDELLPAGDALIRTVVRPHHVVVHCRKRGLGGSYAVGIAFGGVLMTATAAILICRQIVPMLAETRRGLAIGAIAAAALGLLTLWAAILEGLRTQVIIATQTHILRYSRSPFGTFRFEWPVENLIAIRPVFQDPGGTSSTQVSLALIKRKGSRRILMTGSRAAIRYAATAVRSITTLPAAASNDDLKL